MIRRDYAFPFRIDAGSSQAAQVGYHRHVEQLLRQLLLTAQGERVCLPEFGCGLRRLVFAPQSEGLVASVRMEVRQAVERWLAGIVELGEVDVVAGGVDPASGAQEGELRVTVHYRVVDTLTDHELRLAVR